MSLSVTSGIVVAASGSNSATETVNALPVNLFGLQSGVNTSGRAGISYFSGADGGISINVNISGGTLSGIAVSVSGDIVLVVSGGTIQISGTVTTVLAGYQSGILVGISGGSVGLSGLQGVAISGSVTVLPNAYQSGQLVALSGGGAGISGVAVSISGDVVLVTSGSTLPISLVSGSVGAFSGLTILPLGLQSGQMVLLSGATIFNALNTDAVGSASYSWFGVTNTAYAFDGTNWDRTRTVTGSSGGSLGVLAIQQVGYSYTLISGAVVVNAKSGAMFLHSININSYSSGGQFEVRDSSSGVVGTILGTISPTINAITNADLPPASLIYDALLTSGLVVSTSGPFWNLTALWRTATS